MTSLRDARLQRALASAPDGEFRPREETRQAIAQAARAAISQTRPEGSWRWLWARSGPAAMPWGAAFASLLVVCVTTLLWRSEEVPSAKLDADRGVAEQQAKTVTASSTQQGTKDERKATPTAPSEKMQEFHPGQIARLAEGDRESKATNKPTQAPPLPMPVPEIANRITVGKNDAPPDDRAKMQVQSVPRIPMPTVDVSVVPETAPAGRSAPAPATGFALPKLEAAWTAWTRGRLQQGGRAVSFERKDAPVLAQLLDRIPMSAAGPPSLAMPNASLQLWHDGHVLGTLEVGASHLNWMPATGAAVVLEVDAQLLRSVRQELERLPR